MEKQVLAATQTPGEKGNRWFQGTADAVRQFTWVFEVGDYDCIFTNYCILVISIIGFCLIHEGCQEQEYWAYIDTVRWSSLPDGLYGFSAGNYFQPLTGAIVHLVLICIFGKFCLLMGSVFAEAYWHRCWYYSFMCAYGWQVCLALYVTVSTIHKHTLYIIS